jgi:hypothetical protein
MHERIEETLNHRTQSRASGLAKGVVKLRRRQLLAKAGHRSLARRLALARRTRALRARRSSMADRKDFFRQMAAQYRQLTEIASNPEIKQRMLDMAAHYQAKADEDKDAEQSSGEGEEGATRARA